MQSPGASTAAPVCPPFGGPPGHGMAPPPGGYGGPPPGGDYSYPGNPASCSAPHAMPGGSGRCQGINSYPVSFPESSWHTYGSLVLKRISKDQDFKLTWNLEYFLDYLKSPVFPVLTKKRLKSSPFCCAGAIWELFITYDRNRGCDQVGINVHYKESFYSDAMFDCRCRISFLMKKSYGTEPKNIFFRFKYGSPGACQAMCLSSNELRLFLERGSRIVCRISIKSVKEACSQTETFTQTQLPENGGKELPKVNLNCKVCRDLKNLLLSGEDSDIIIQVRDQQFKAHRSILSARSPVFASMFHHDTKEKATGVVDVEDCEPSDFSILLYYLYCGSTENLAIENMFAVYTAADKYCVQDLKRKCLEFIVNNLTVETFCETVKLSLQNSEADLLKLTVDFFAKHFKKIVKTTKWQAFILENPAQGNEIWSKALVSDDDD